MKKNSIYEYIRALLNHSANFFSVFSIIFVLIAWFVPMNLLAKTQISMIFAILCIVYAGYKTWKDEVEKQSQKREFIIVTKSNHFGTRAYFGDGRIDPNLKLSILFDFINNTDELITINRPELTKLQMNSDLYKEKLKSIKFSLLNNSFEQIVFPYQIEKKNRISMRCEIGVTLIDICLDDFAFKLKDLENYNLEIEFTYEDMTALTVIKKVKIDGSYEEFKNEIIEYWKEKNKYELITKAAGIVLE